MNGKICACENCELMVLFLDGTEWFTDSCTSTENLKQAYSVQIQVRGDDVCNHTMTCLQAFGLDKMELS